MSHARIAAALLILCTGACTPRAKSAPTLEKISPNPVLNDAPAALTFTGTGFGRRLVANLDDPDTSTLDATYKIEVRLASAPDSIERMALTDATWNSDTELTATLPAGLPPGDYAVWITDAWQHVIERDGLLTVTAPIPPECTTANDCDDGIDCTTDACVDQHCTHPLAAGFCEIGGACVPQGANPDNACQRCAPEVSADSWSPAPDTDPCDDGLSCTVGDHCDGAGACASGATDCVNSVNGCLEAMGTCTANGCTFQNKAKDTPCSDGVDCTGPDVCDGAGACVAGPASCGVVMPTACLTVTPSVAAPGATLTFDASCSTDVDAPASQLLARYDFDGDGVFDTSFGPLTATYTAQMGGGTFLPYVEVVDATNASDSARAFYVVSSPSNEVVVTTAVDENTGGATPTNPGGTGLSLREAIAYVNGLGSPRTITFSGPMTIKPGAALDLHQANSAIVGQPGVTIDFSNLGNTSCLNLSDQDERVIGARFEGCPGQAVAVKATGGQIAFCTFRPGTSTAGSAVKFDETGNFGPGNDVRDFTMSEMVQIKNQNVIVVGNHFENGSVVADVISSGDNLHFERNEVVGFTQPALQISNGASGQLIRFNTFVKTVTAIAIQGTSTGVAQVQNNVFVDGIGCALTGNGASVYGAITPNLFFANGGTNCIEKPTDPANVSADPMFIGKAAGNFRLLSQSPAIDKGVDLGFDVNGPASGNFFGAAPDLGAHEASY